jgi:hypothetical protein
MEEDLTGNLWYKHLYAKKRDDIERDFQRNAVDDIASSRGWLPLRRDEEMTVHYQGKEYVIKRTK